MLNFSRLFYTTFYLPCVIFLKKVSERNISGSFSQNLNFLKKLNNSFQLIDFTYFFPCRSKFHIIIKKKKKNLQRKMKIFMKTINFCSFPKFIFFQLLYQNFFAKMHLFFLYITTRSDDNDFPIGYSHFLKSLTYTRIK